MTGGEIFVPKIPSMRITDLIDVLAPGYPINVTGIRPGEKLHEVMITNDDVENTIEFDNCYVIKPSNIPKLRGHEHIIEGKHGTPITEGFSYRSDLNEWWLNGEDLRKMLVNLDMAESV